MTEQEAIKNIKALNAVCWQKDFYDEEFAKALALAIKTIEKQIPKKPIQAGNGHKCVCCDHYIDQRDWHSSYCGVCGQKLDWGDE